MIFFGYLGEKYNGKNNNLTLKMVTYDYTGRKRLRKKPGLELFDITDTDYRFRDSNGNEYIIPIEQIQEIEYDNTKNSNKMQGTLGENQNELN